MQRVFCVRKMKSLETLNQMKQIVVLKHWMKKCNKSSLEILNQKKIKSLYF